MLIFVGHSTREGATTWFLFTATHSSVQARVLTLRIAADWVMRKRGTNGLKGRDPQPGTDCIATFQAADCFPQRTQPDGLGYGMKPILGRPMATTFFKPL